ncbi:MAG: LysM peptidoglycan-binding domain-containing protein [Chloroflexi bacterium]|nr:LysM peptidoglycan-binding domain-containing protein [Ardenticatenaceae bacterium]MBL1130474.1 LysM peptidoglycan-binding domain-containing protein [Chloroflexota bacterium]NOG36564.1 LysM peptidoglycan-binding domain-containing protein [Chloroflexota bacterium]
MDQVQAASAHVENPHQREQLQAILFHWNGYVHSQTGAYPGIQLAAFSPPAAAPGPEHTARVTTAAPPELTLPRVHWLVWVAAVVLFLGGAIIVIWPLLFGNEEDAVAAPTLQAEAVYTAVAATQTTIAYEATVTRTVIEQTANAAALLFATATSSETAVSETPPPTGPVVYTVQAGDTLFTIARRYGLTLDEIMILNGLTTDALAVGQTLTLPHPPLTPEGDTAVNNPAVTPPPPATATLTPGQQLAEMVIRASSASLYSGPGAQFSTIMPLARGTFAYAVGRSQAGDWYLLQLEDGVTRGWLPATDVALLYPAVPDIIPVIVVP